MKWFKGLILNAAFYPSFLLFTLVFTVALFPWVLWGRIAAGHPEAVHRIRTAIRWYGQAALWVLPKPFLTIRFENRAQEQDALRPYIVITNHRSLSDPFLMGWFSFEIVQIVNVWPFKIPFLGLFARLAGYLSVNEMAYEDFNACCGALLDRGVSLIGYPEGTRATGNQLGQFRSAMFRVALEKRAPIAPLCISGNEDKPRRGSLWLNPGVIRVRRLPTIPYEFYRDFSPFKLKMYLRDLIARETQAMDAES